MRVLRSRNLGLATLVAVAAVALSGCLGPDQPDPTGTAPFGHLDRVVPESGGFRAIGWVADPDTSAPITVSVSSEQRPVTATADLERPDVAAAHPSLGPRHGFDVSFGGLTPGPHQVCVWADNVGPGTEGRLLGCTYVTVPSSDPMGTIDSVVTGDRTISVSGWALDPDTTDPIVAGVLLDGVPVVRESADGHRPDVAAAHGLGSAHGYSYVVPAAPGTHLLCVIAENVGPGSSQWLGCRSVEVAVPVDRRPTGAVTSVVPVGSSSVRVRGTAVDPDTAGAVTVRVAVDGVDHVVQTSAGAYDTTISGLAPGAHEVCVTATDVPTAAGPSAVSGDRSWPCGTVLLSSVSVGSSGAPSAPPVPVGPADGNPLAGIDRDAGISVQLRDGSVLWLFGDSSASDPAGNLRYFVNNTAAWARAGSPTVTQDGATGGEPVQFASPDGSAWTCTADRPTKALWPSAAVRSDAGGGKDLVTVFLANVCLGDGPLEIEGRGMSVARWTYDPSDPPIGVPVTGQVIDHQLFPAGREYGTAATTGLVGGVTYVYAYDCDTPPDDGEVSWPDEFGPCRVGRVPASAVDDRPSWRFWNGATWVSDVGAAVGIIPGPSGGADPQAPVASATVSWDQTHGVYVMAYSPWPGFTDRVFVRVATEPQGPWSDVVEVQLPGCVDTVGTVGFYCYAGTAQPALSGVGTDGEMLLGLGYYDQLVSIGPNRGQYMTITVPFHVMLPG